MKQVYDLLETIREDEMAVAECEKQLHYLKSVLSAHESALKRLTNVAESVSTTETKCDSEKRVRITHENWKSLGIEVGDKVEIVVSGDDDFEGDIYEVMGLEMLGYEGELFMRLGNDDVHSWYYYNKNRKCQDELYLIKRGE